MPNMCINSCPNLIMNFFKVFIARYLFYNIVLVSAIHQHESVIGIHMFPPSEASLEGSPLGCHRALVGVP